MNHAAHMTGMAYTPYRYERKYSFERLIDFFMEPSKMDHYGRTGIRQWLDKATGVSEHQLMVRYGQLKHKVVPHVPEARNYVHWVEDWCDALVERWGAKLPPPRELVQKPVPFDYTRCW